MRKIVPPLQSWSSAIIAALVGFGGTIALVVHALQGMGASVEQTGSGVTALCLGIGLSGALLSLKFKMPVVLAWSTPGAALLAAAPAGLTWPVTIGIFIFAAVLMIIVGVTPVLGRLIVQIPSSVASAMLAGVLLPFCLELFRLGSVDPLLIASLVIIFLAARQRAPIYALILVLISAIGFTTMRQDMGPIATGRIFGSLLPVMPIPDLVSIVSLGIPLFLVTLVSQNLPGLVVLRSADYAPPAGPIIAITGLTSLTFAPIGAHGINLAAITATLCTGSDAHPEHSKRWQVGVIYGFIYLLLAAFAPALVRLFLALPSTVIMSVTGIALIPPLIGSVEKMMSEKKDYDAAIVTFLATGSGVVFLGLGSAFWGLIAGMMAIALKSFLRKR